MSEIMSEDRDAIQAALEAAITDEKLAPVVKKARALAKDMVADIEYTLKDYLAANLAHHVKEMAARAVTALLEGNESEMRRWLGADGYTGRHGEGGHRTVAEQHPVIHGKLFETGGVTLRRKIAEAHRDLISDQRILDLEDQVRSLVEQNNRLKIERDSWCEKARAYS